MPPPQTTRFWVEVGLAVVNAVVLGVTAVWHDWIEAVFHVSPDAGSGAAEWLVVAVTACLTVTSLALAATEFRRERVVG